jgi:mRNA interferase MazF
MPGQAPSADACILVGVKELEPSSIVLLEQIRTVDKRRLTWHVGNIGEEKMSEIDAALTASVGL